jgi:hypothetical protein
MLSTDLYTKSILTVIALCLAVLCLQGSHWNHPNTVHAADGQMIIGGYSYYDSGAQKIVTLGTNYGQARGIPVIVINK